MRKKCGSCYYYSRSSRSCDYLLITGETRDCPANACDVYLSRNDKERPRIGVQVRRRKPKASKERPDEAQAESPTPVKLTPSRLRELYKQGLGDEEIADLAGRSLQTILLWRRKAGLAPRKRSRKPTKGGNTV